jgi:hypothetical protein
MKRIEYGNTFTFEFQCLEYDSVLEEYTNVLPDSVEAYVEEDSESLTQIQELTDITSVSTGVYWINFYASTETNEAITLGKTFFLSFYWTKEGITKVERIKMAVVANV